MLFLDHSLKPLIGIPAWHFEDVSGTGKLQRVFLEHLYLMREFNFLICLPFLKEDFLKKASLKQRKKLLAPNIGLAFLEKDTEELYIKWLGKAYLIFKSKKAKLIFYCNPDVYHLGDIPFVSIIHDVMPITLREYTSNPFKKWLEKKKLEKK